MRLKTKYRQQYRDGGAVIAQDKPIEQPLENAPVETSAPAVDAPPPPPPLAEPEPPMNDATLALRKQIEGVKNSAQLQHQQQQAIIGTELRRREWLAGHPKAQANVDALGPLHHIALEAGLADASPQYFAFLESQLDAMPDGAPAMSTPEFFKPPPAAAAPSASSRPVPTSAPVSRAVPNGSGSRPSGGNKIHLSPDEVAAARLSGISVEEYAKQKMKYQGLRASGDYTDARDRR